MQISCRFRKFLWHAGVAASTLTLLVGLTQPASAVDFAGTNNSSGKLLYIQTPNTDFTLSSVAGQPVGVTVAPGQEILYTISSVGEVHAFNPYTRTDVLLAKGFTTPTDIIVDPGCASMLVSDIGVNKVFRITFSSRAVTTFYNGPDTIGGLVYDNFGNLYANDLSLGAIVQFTTQGVITAQTPGPPLTALEGLTYDQKSASVFATSNTGQVLYQAPGGLSSVTTIPFAYGPVLEGVTSDGVGDLYVVGGTGTANNLYKYVESTGAVTQLNAVPGLDRIAIIPPGPCIHSLGTDQACEQ
jgi:hypothetical protein